MIMVENLENRKKTRRGGKNVHSRLGTLLKGKKRCIFTSSKLRNV